MEAPIDIRHLTKAFDGHRAVDGLNLQVPEGSVYGFLGANGAGKTTTIRAIMGHLHPTEGQVLTLGQDPWHHRPKLRRRVAYVSETMNVPGWMTPTAALRFCQSQYPKWDRDRAVALLKEFELEKLGPYRKLSKGQKRRVCIVLALCQNADLLVMDEPAAGLDMMARRDFLDRIIDLACEGDRTLFISSHILSDLERVVDRICVIHRGKLRLEGELESLKAGIRKLHFPGKVPREALTTRFQVLNYEAGEEETLATVLDFDQERFLQLCARLGVSDRAQQVGFSLEDLFVEISKSTETEISLPAQEGD